MKLVIVESPTKAKTISKFLGKDFTVKSSFGHVRDLPKSDMGIDIEHDFKPKYIVPTKAKTKITELKKISEKAQEVILASDEDREGEAISWHLVQALGLDSKNKKPYSRIVFHEITKSAIEHALANPRTIDESLVDAQQARRVLDRLVGYELSPFLWKKVRRGLSAGRVQSVALRFIVEREREIQAFAAENFWTISANLFKDNKDNAFEANLVEKNGEKIEETKTIQLFAGEYKTKKTIIDSEEKAVEIANDLKSALYTVSDVIEKETLRTPPAPFTTSTLQQAAISNFGFSAKQTMSIAQKLYEEGLITYMRTDSVNLSLESLVAAKKTIEKIFGKTYSLESPRYYKTKSKSAQEAHEAIRPAYPDKTPEDVGGLLDPQGYKLYSLIWKRMIACQMQNAKMKSVRAEIAATTKANAYALRANGSTVVFDGFLKVLGEKSIQEKLLPELKQNDSLTLDEVVQTGKTTTPPPRYNEATLVKVLEENNIGRPSTYAPTLSTIIERKYVDKNEEKRLYPLEIGILVNDILVQHFPEIVSIDFTATMETDFDEIAEGNKQWVPVIREFYGPFHKNILSKTETVKKEEEKLDRNCPDCGGDLLVKYGRFGKFIACSNYPTCKYTEKTAEEKKVDEEHSGIVCDKCGSPMVVKRGRFGAFLGCSNYPECKNIQRIENKIGVSCPKCNKGEIVARKSKRGKMFYGCNKYPECDFVLWNKPTGEKCPECGELLVFAAKGMVQCSSKECTYKKQT